MGSGGVGGFYGARLAGHGVDVTFIARGAHLQAIRQNGLILREENQETVIRPVTAVEETSGLAPVDLIFFTVKLPDTEAALAACQPLLHERTSILTLQNGVESVAMIERFMTAQGMGSGRVLGGAVYIVSNILEPGVILKTGPSERLEFAEPDGTRSERASAVQALCHDAGIDAHLQDNLESLLWRKFILLSASSSITALTRQPMGFAQQDPVAQEIVRAAIAETVAVARARDIALPGDIEEKTLRTLNFVVHPNAKASQLVDLERGKPLELEWLSGAIHRMGKEAQVPTPIHSTTYAALRPFAAGRS
jgi:2-dehydropantoate 2-reductase